ncbi:hypothetical protein RF11_14017 [Thelohanellus kitauei]|uniref:Uncharacterized protein n=1 Tax=Thelohanellus kitauei TaxID=669202 RepID=A0A0C2M6H0_THEKT|nr:hypothetical protein RF11_14017 [Thelohanellus kitauei]
MVMQFQGLLKGFLLVVLLAQFPLHARSFAYGGVHPMHPMANPMMAAMINPMLNPMMGAMMNPMMAAMMNPMMAAMVNPMMGAMTHPMMHPMVNPMMAAMMHPMMLPFAGIPPFMPMGAGMFGGFPMPGMIPPYFGGMPGMDPYQGMGGMAPPYKRFGKSREDKFNKEEYMTQGNIGDNMKQMV